ncbi:uncharacterized protein LOC128398074 [Panonychus citri]|uniref:uncharacterized protein LOC128398074 n=1 Tax=Panonychus citri TaxID=50023 RepID=UPI002307A988|nr:uncharacterized protein LOC128398072 isoform X1 [Panonychus citri]XP_053214862.1 uncharacterized protein LOC128398072 isoform X2 [Panonychus citri]XP_053214865.1 uncharacterized protein LOC128398074 [Panonychus citri]
MCIIRKNTSNCDDDLSVNIPEEVLINNHVSDNDGEHGEETITSNETQIDLDRQIAEGLQARELARQDRERERDRARRFREQQQRAILRPQPTFIGLGCRGKGYKKYRRYENANLFKDLPVIDGDDHLGELSIYDFVPHSMTALSQLLMNKENMQIWNHFIHLPEEIQESFLEKYRKRDSNKSLKNGSKQSKIRST